MGEATPTSKAAFFKRPPPPPPAPPLPPRPSSSLPPPQASLAALRRPVFHGSGGTLLGIHVVNVLLTLVTLGIYYPWAKTRIRRYLFSESAFEGDRFAYHGTGRELLMGFLKAFLVFLLPAIVLSTVADNWPGLDVSIRNVVALLISVLFLVFTPVAMAGARRYRLSRTSWRGIRFSFRGRAWDLILIFVKGYVLAGFTFGLYYPFYLTQRQGFMVSHSYFGNERFEWDGQGRELFGSYVLAILLTLPTLGLCWIWFLASKRRFFWNHTHFGPARFRSTVTGGALLWLYLVNALLLVLTLGIAWPWVRVRNIRVAYRYLALDGRVDFERIQQQAQFASATGEGLAGFLDTGFDLG
jgi:uncharacterized membrane protein YjgN (DUF898 family)